jgi:undecaprenyl-diphosphatase
LPLESFPGILSNHPVPDWLNVILLGVIEGITEFLPISSTAHLLIAGHWLAPQSDLFNVVIQSGAVLAVIPLFWNRCRQFVFQYRDPQIQRYFLKLMLAFGLTGAGGLLLEKNDFKLPEELGPVAWALLVGGICFLGIEHWLKGKKLSDEISWTVAVAVGIGQLVAAVFPGASRSGTTILMALLLGLNRPVATEFSFLVGIPTMLAAGGMKVYKALFHSSPNDAAVSWGLVALGTLVSALVSFLVVKWLLRYIQSHTFSLFGWYRIALGVVLLAVFLR